jgi:hypothetical protein
MMKDETSCCFGLITESRHVVSRQIGLYNGKLFAINDSSEADLTLQIELLRRETTRYIIYEAIRS